MSHRNNDFPILLSLALNSLLTVFELVFGVLSGSLALVADGARNLTDSLLLGVSFVAEHISRREPDKHKTWGYGRIKIIAALLNTGIIITIAMIIGFEAISRFNAPKAVHGSTVILVAGLGVAVNAAAAMLLKSRRGELNVRTSYTALKFGAFSSAGVVVAGMLIAAFKWTWVDDVTGIVIAALLLYASIRLAGDAVHILLEGVPDGISMRQVEQRLLKVKNVIGINEVHAWSIEDSQLAFSCHLVIEPEKLSSSRRIVNAAKKILTEDYGFSHITIEVDVP